MVKLVYTADLKSAALTERTGSSPVAATKSFKDIVKLSYFGVIAGLVLAIHVSSKEYENGVGARGRVAVQNEIYSLPIAGLPEQVR